MPATTTYTCADGTPFVVQWVKPGDENETWVFNDEHWPKPATPMGMAIETIGLPGHARCYAEAGVIPMPIFEYFMYVNGYQYARDFAPPSPDIAEGYGRFLAAHGGTIRGPWEIFCEPRIKQAVADIAASGQAARIADLADSYMYGWHQTFSSVGAMTVPLFGLVFLLAETYGPEVMLVSQELGQGGANASQAIDGELAEFANAARGDAALAAAIDAHGWDAFRERARQTPSGTAFVERLDAFVARHALRSTTWDLMDPTWGNVLRPCSS